MTSRADYLDSHQLGDLRDALAEAVHDVADLDAWIEANKTNRGTRG